jgi:hypothetical protein
VLVVLAGGVVEGVVGVTEAGRIRSESFCVAYRRWRVDRRPTAGMWLLAGLYRPNRGGVMKVHSGTGPDVGRQANGSKVQRFSCTGIVNQQMGK